MPANPGRQPRHLDSGRHRRRVTGRMQIIGRHHEEQLLLDLAVVAERERPWPLVAPGSPH